LGRRIKDPGAFAAPPALPDPVTQAAQHFWEAALAETRRDFDERLHDGLTAAVANVEVEKERAAIADRAAFEASSKLARLQTELELRDAELAAERQAHMSSDTQLAASRAQVEDLRARLDAALAETIRLRDGAQAAVAEALGRFASAERRATLEIDVERVARTKAERRAEYLEKRLGEAQMQVRTLEAQHATEMTELRAKAARLSGENHLYSSREAALLERLAVLEAVAAEAKQGVAAANAQAELAERILQSLNARQPSGGRHAAPKRRNLGKS
jgi:chromosome segregation ATPase